MSTQDTGSLTRLLDAAVEAVQVAHRSQRYDGDPCHEDFYAWGWCLSDLAAQLAGIVVLLRRQIEEYPTRWELRDDAGMDPASRIGRCAELLAQMGRPLGSVSALARDYHNEMSHVAVETIAGGDR